MNSSYNINDILTLINSQNESAKTWFDNYYYNYLDSVCITETNTEFSNLVNTILSCSIEDDINNNLYPAEVYCLGLILANADFTSSTGVKDYLASIIADPMLLTDVEDNHLALFNSFWCCIKSCMIKYNLDTFTSMAPVNNENAFDLKLFIREIILTIIQFYHDNI